MCYSLNSNVKHLIQEMTSTLVDDFEVVGMKNAIEVENYCFANFSCMFLNSDIFFQFEF